MHTVRVNGKENNEINRTWRSPRNQEIPLDGVRKVVSVHAVKANGEMEVHLHSILASALRECELLLSRASRFTHVEGATMTQWKEGWVGPRSGMATLTRKIPRPCREQNQDSLHRLRY